MKKAAVTLVMRTLAVFIFILGIYFLLFVYPVISAKHILTAALRDLGRQRTALTERHLLTGELRLLDTNSTNFAADHTKLIEAIQKSSSSKPTVVRSTYVLPLVTPEARYINGELHSVEAQLNRRQNDMFTTDSSALRRGLNLDNDIKKIFLYSPQNDLIAADTVNKLEPLSAHTAAAITGLGNIQRKLAPDFPLQSDISTTITALEALKSAVSTGDLAATEAARQIAVLQFTRLQKSALETEAGQMKLSDQKGIQKYYDDVSLRLTAKLRQTHQYPRKP